jgi:hypothetical protein
MFSFLKVWDLEAFGATFWSQTISFKKYDIYKK